MSKTYTPKYDSPLWQMSSVRAYFERVDILPMGMDYGIKVERRGQYFAPLWLAKAVEVEGAWQMVLRTLDPDHPPQPNEKPTDDEQAAMGAELRLYGAWPKYVDWLTEEEAEREAGDPAKACGPDWTLFPLLGIDRQLLGYHVRVITPEGGKDYCYLTLWEEDGEKEWKFAQPPGQLPLYNLPALNRDEFNGIVAIHEGAKSCRGAIAASKDTTHPWHRELAEMTHLAFIGGAHMPWRTDWSPLKRIGAAGTRLVYIFADNDPEGMAAIPKISSQLDIRCLAVLFRGDFPRKFDLGEPMPERLFTDGHYHGPSLPELIEPATYATEQREINGRQVHVLRDVFAESFAYLSQVGGFVSFDKPSRPPIRHEDFNKAYRYLAPKGYNIAEALTHKSTHMLTWIGYRPDKQEDLGHCTTVQRTIQGPQGGIFNAYEPTNLEPEPGDIEPWLSYLEHMFPDEEDRAFVTRFLATLIGRPDIKMEMALMLTSQTKGVGKSTLYELFLRPLIGPWNCSTIDEHALTSRFASWMPFKRLAFAHEIYLHGRWDAFQSLKTKVTEQSVTCEMKWLNPMTVDNFCTIIVCSNSPLPLMMEPGDRRWIYPKMREVKMPRAMARDLHAWAKRRGGLEAILDWAQNFDGEYIERGEHAPLSETKQCAIDDSRSEANNIALECALALKGKKEAACFSIQHLMGYLEAKKLVKPGARSTIIKQTIKEVTGVYIPGGRYKVQGRRHQLVVNKALLDEIGTVGDDDSRLAMAPSTKIILVKDLLEDDPI